MGMESTDGVVYSAADRPKRLSILTKVVSSLHEQQQHPSPQSSQQSQLPRSPNLRTCLMKRHPSTSSKRSSIQEPVSPLDTAVPEPVTKGPPSVPQGWEVRFDPILKQYYYVNMIKNFIQLDHPEEVILHSSDTESDSIGVMSTSPEYVLDDAKQKKKWFKFGRKKSPSVSPAGSPLSSPLVQQREPRNIFLNANYDNDNDNDDDDDEDNEVERHSEEYEKDLRELREMMVNEAEVYKLDRLRSD